MSVSYKSQVVAIKKEGDASANADIARNALKKQLGRKSRESVRAILLPEFASVYKVKLVTGEGSGSGKKSSNTGYGNATFTASTASNQSCSVTSPRW